VKTFVEEVLKPNCFRPWWSKTLIRPKPTALLSE